MQSLLEYFPEPFLIDILDVGASLNNAPPYEPLMEAGRARLTGFEPDATEIARLRELYGAPHRFFPNFIGDGRPGTYHETNWVLTGSLFEPNTPLLEKFQNLAELTKPMARHPVSTTRLDDLPEIGNVDFFKIDVQGGELAVFQNALNALSTTLLIHTEVEFVEMYRGQPLFADVDAFLRSRGFQFHSFVGFGGRALKPMIPNGNVNASFGQMLWSDAWYVRDWMALDKLSPRQLAKYAVLAHDVQKAVDLAHFVLAELDRRSGSSLAPAYLERVIGGGAGAG